MPAFSRSSLEGAFYIHLIRAAGFSKQTPGQNSLNTSWPGRSEPSASMNARLPGSPTGPNSGPMRVGDQAVVQQVDQPADVALLQLLQRVADDLHAHLVVERAPAALGGQQRLARPSGRTPRSASSFFS